MWTSTQYRQLVRGSAWYDLVVKAAFATPWSFAVVHGLLSSLMLVVFLVFDLAWGVALVLPVRDPSRASPLPHWNGVHSVNCGSGLAREEAVTVSA